MKTILVLLIALIINKSFGQERLSFEKKINNESNYNLQDIDFYDTVAKIKLGGTLISPKSEYSKVVIIAPGSGKDTRNSHYILAEEFLKNGIAVFRYDDRGIGKSEGNYKNVPETCVADLYYAFNHLRKLTFLENKKIGILGHSMGGYAAINAYKDELGIDFLILMSTPIERKGKFLNHQFNTKNGKITFEAIYKNIIIPTLFITGTKDSIVKSESTLNLLNNLNNTKITIKIMNGLNHYLRVGKDDWRDNKDYSSIYEMNKTALAEIISWVTSLKI